MQASSETLDGNAQRITRDVAIPPCPTLLTRLLREARADEPDPQRIGHFVTGDVGLAAAVLNIANSSFYALRTKVGSVHQAVAMLGVDAVVQLVTGLLLRQAFPTGKGRAMEQYWRRSTASALIAALLLRETQRASAEAGHTYALFRDCGMPVLQQKYRDYEDIFDGSAFAAGTPILELENARYGTNHCRVGAQLARHWQLSEALAEAILKHHEGEQAATDTGPRLLIAVGLVAEELYCDASNELFERGEDLDWALGLLSLSRTDLAAVAQRIRPMLG